MYPLDFEEPRYSDFTRVYAASAMMQVTHIFSDQFPNFKFAAWLLHLSLSRTEET